LETSAAWETDTQLNQASTQREINGIAPTGKPPPSGVLSTGYLPASKDIRSNQLGAVLLPRRGVRATSPF